MNRYLLSTIIVLLFTANIAHAAIFKEDRYEAKLTKHITEYQKYPTSAQLYGFEGDIILRLQINKKGIITDYSLVHKSKHKSLNKAIDDMIDAANPAPIPPKSYFKSGENLVEFMLPIAFRKNENAHKLQQIDQLFQKESHTAIANPE